MKTAASDSVYARRTSALLVGRSLILPLVPGNLASHGWGVLAVPSACFLAAAALVRLGLAQPSVPPATSVNTASVDQPPAEQSPSVDVFHGSREWTGELERAVDRGIEFLLARQNPNGSWGSPRNTKRLNIYAPVPGAHQAFRAAVTALCVSALLESGRRSEAVDQAVIRAEDWLLRELPHLRRATPDAIYNVWGHAFSIQALVRLIHRPGQTDEKRSELRKLIASQIDLLRRYEAVGGGWAYYDFNVGTQRPAGESNCFVTATVLVAFHEARQEGFEIPSDLVDRAVKSIVRQRKPDFSYLYSEDFVFYPMAVVNRPAGSLGRSQACNLATRLWGDQAVTDLVLESWLRRLIERNGWLDIGRKRPIPHESWFAIAGYFFYYGHYYAACCIQQLPLDKRLAYARPIAEVIVRLQEKDGSWWDFPLYDYHQQYGTAFAIMTLVRCRPENSSERLAANP
ncbi:MAG: terpene cyclase/mutase family protein [Thermoguttaceae bacterium]|nr:terpene cyclase/mutase family protein [Thermoguttaceae bacterium]MDW8080013.1 terpene cyclase/mutase family protein [Thermoguttaceae bacterium]